MKAGAIAPAFLLADYEQQKEFSLLCASMNHQPRNKSIYTDQGRAEIFFQTINLDHYLTKYLKDLNRPDDKRFHRLTFNETTKVLSQGNILIQKYADSKKSITPSPITKAVIITAYFIWKSETIVINCSL